MCLMRIRFPTSEKQPQTHGWNNFAKPHPNSKFSCARNAAAFTDSLSKPSAAKPASTPTPSRPIIAPLIASKQLIGATVEHAAVSHLLWPGALSEAVELLFKELERTEAHSLSRAELRSRTKLEDWVFALATVRLPQVKPVQVVGNQFTLRGVGVKEPTEALAKVEALYRAAGPRFPDRQ